MVFILGKTDENLKANIEKIKSMDLESMNGLMEGNMKDSGLKENNME
jgi:hypothetical protein